MRIALHAIYICQFGGPTLRVIMARICVTRNTMANTRERQTQRAGRRRARMPEGEREKKRKRGRAGACELLRGARCNDNAFCRMTDSFHIAGGCCGCVGRDARMRPRTHKFSLSRHITNLKSDATTSVVYIVKVRCRDVKDYY